MSRQHTILLVQFNQETSSRTYLDFEDLPEALDGARRTCDPASTTANPTAPPRAA